MHALIPSSLLLFGRSWRRKTRNSSKRTRRGVLISVLETTGKKGSKARCCPTAIHPPLPKPMCRSSNARWPNNCVQSPTPTGTTPGVNAGMNKDDARPVLQYSTCNL